jgi:hypothetical protein
MWVTMDNDMRGCMGGCKDNDLPYVLAVDNSGHDGALTDKNVESIDFYYLKMNDYHGQVGIEPAWWALMGMEVKFFDNDVK